MHNLGRQHDAKSVIYNATTPDDHLTPGALLTSVCTRMSIKPMLAAPVRTLQQRNSA
jgi:hypothetical protein